MTDLAASDVAPGAVIPSVADNLRDASHVRVLVVTANGKIPIANTGRKNGPGSTKTPLGASNLCGK
jgi:hypothetical protein